MITYLFLKARSIDFLIPTSSGFVLANAGSQNQLVRAEYRSMVKMTPGTSHQNWVQTVIGSVFQSSAPGTKKSQVANTFRQGNGILGKVGLMYSFHQFAD